MNLSIGLPQKLVYGNNKEMETGIYKLSTEKALLTKNGFSGDGVANLKFHGGPDRAVCFYPYEHYVQWEREFNRPLPSSAFGENVTASHMLEEDVFIGNIYQLGEAVIQITQGRIPCSTINKRTNNDLILDRLIETGFTGYFARVLEEGIVDKDSPITLLETHPKQVSVLFANETYFHKQKDVERIHTILEVDELANDWRERLTKRLQPLT